MGARLSGIELFVQPIPSNLDDAVEVGALEDEVRDVASGDFKKLRCGTYIAPFFYTQVTVLDAKTQAVIRQEARYDFRKIINSEAAVLDVEKKPPTTTTRERNRTIRRKRRTSHGRRQ